MIKHLNNSKYKVCFKTGRVIRTRQKKIKSDDDKSDDIKSIKEINSEIKSENKSA